MSKRRILMFLSRVPAFIYALSVPAAIIGWCYGVGRVVLHFFPNADPAAAYGAIPIVGTIAALLVGIASHKIGQEIREDLVEAPLRVIIATESERDHEKRGAVSVKESA